jgi:hypothetical protein
MRTLDKHLWIVLLAIAVVVTVACSGSSSAPDQEGGPASEAAALTQG